MKIVIFKRFGEYCTTTEENYKSRIWNANRIQEWNDFSSPEEIIEYSIKYFKADKDDYIIIDKGVE